MRHVLAQVLFAAIVAATAIPKTDDKKTRPIIDKVRIGALFVLNIFFPPEIYYTPPAILTRVSASLFFHFPSLRQLDALSFLPCLIIMRCPSF
jgi:hypothetical protein